MNNRPIAADERTPTADERPPTTENERRVLYRILLDSIILVLLYTPLLLFKFFAEPFHRGFFCSDESIRYPFRDSTVSKRMLVLITTALPVTVMLVVELTRYFFCDRKSKTHLLFSRNVPVWILEFFKYLSCFIFGSVITHDATAVAKYTIGRLRPHFMSVCQPQLADGSTCDAPQNLHRYIEDYTCAGIGYTHDDLRVAHISFPSGHSSLSFYAMLYLVFYLQYKLTWRGSRFLRHLLQFLLLMLAWFTALSRVMDYYHHWSDVLCGSLLGITIAMITSLLIVPNFRTALVDLDEGRETQGTCAALDKITTMSPDL